jgi:hypothetical protein
MRRTGQLHPDDVENSSGKGNSVDRYIGQILEEDLIPYRVGR